MTVNAHRAAVPLPEDEFGDLAGQGLGKPDYSVPDSLKAISGFTNYTPHQMRVTSQWKTDLAEVFRKYGYTPMDPRPVEYASNLQLTGGLTKQIYGVSRLQDGGLTKMGLPFDRTVPMAIMIAQHHQKMSFPYARYDIGWSWRGEHASTGRYRAFIQADMDIVDRALTARSDAQCIVAMIKGLQKLEVPKCTVFLNHIGIAKAFLKAEGILPAQYNDALRAIDKLKPDNEAEVVAELVQNVPTLKPDQARNLLAKMNYRGPLSEFKFPVDPGQEAKEAFAHLQEIEKIATLMQIEKGTLQFAPNLTRGLDYYTGVVFESFIPGKERYGSVASGGRYDNLVGEFNKNLKLQGIGGSIGLTRLYDVMQAEGLVDLSKETTSQVFVGYRDETTCLERAIEVANALRESGIYTELHTADLKVKKQLALVDDKGIPYTILVMNPHEIILKETHIKKSSEEQTPQHTFKTVQEAVVFMQAKKEAGLLDPKPIQKDPVESKKDN